MRQIRSEIAVLNAEEYDTGFKRAAAKSRKTHESSDDTDDGASRPGKKAKMSDKAADAKADEKKRSRGRPRLDTTDETAADRRRTQIRLAQRAYRSRKENAIQSLEKQVQELKRNNEEMSNAFMKLHDFAVSQGMLENIPEFGRQLRATTEQFLASAKKSHERDSKDVDDDQPDQPEDEVASPDESPFQKPSEDSRRGTASPSPELVHRAPPPLPQVTQTQFLGGIIVTHEPAVDASLFDPSWAAAASFVDPPATTRTPDYEIVTMPTFENASFPSGMGNSFDFTNTFLQSSPYYTLPMPDSNAWLESTFGRRLQRMALEVGITLITMKDPPMDSLRRVFGFCMRFESLEQIKDRLLAGIEKSKQESLHHWRAPFLQLGGAGTHYPGYSSTTTPPSLEEGCFFDDTYPFLGNQGTIERFKHQNVSTGFGMGPYKKAVIDARDNLISEEMHIKLPGFEGEFYDPDEVERYLFERGVRIGPAQDYVTTEIDFGLFEDDQEEIAGNGSLDGTATEVDMTSASRLASFDGGNVASPGVGTSSPESDPSMLSFRSTSMSSSSSPSSLEPTSADIMAPAAWLPDRLELGLKEAESEYATLMGSTATISPTMYSTATPKDILAAAGVTPNGHGTPGAAAPKPSKKKLVTFDVNAFIRDLAWRTTCLGRAPGYRVKDINAAVRAATADVY